MMLKICFQCRTIGKHEDCEDTVYVRGLGNCTCGCKIQNHALKTYVIQATFEVQEFSPSNAKSVLSDLLAYNSKLPAFTNMEIVFPLDPI